MQLRTRKEQILSQDCALHEAWIISSKMTQQWLNLLQRKKTAEQEKNHMHKIDEIFSHSLKVNKEKLPPLSVRKIYVLLSFISLSRFCNHSCALLRDRLL